MWGVRCIWSCVNVSLLFVVLQILISTNGGDRFVSNTLVSVGVPKAWSFSHVLRRVWSLTFCLWCVRNVLVARLKFDFLFVVFRKRTRCAIEIWLFVCRGVRNALAARLKSYCYLLYIQVRTTIIVWLSPVVKRCLPKLNARSQLVLNNNVNFATAPKS